MISYGFFFFFFFFFNSPIFRFSFGSSLSMAHQSFTVGYLLPLHICIYTDEALLYISHGQGRLICMSMFRYRFLLRNLTIV